MDQAFGDPHTQVYSITNGAGGTSDEFVFLHGAALNLDITTVRGSQIIVSPSGGGRTRQLAEFLKLNRDSALVVIEDFAPEISSNILRRLARWFRQQADRSEKWRDLWWVSTLGSVGSHLVFGGAPRAPDVKDSALRTYLDEKFGVRSPLSPTAILKKLVAGVRGKDFIALVESIADDPDFEEIERIICEIVPDDQPVLLFIEELATVNEIDRPHWYRCMAGLMYCASRIAEHQLGQHVWFCCAIEDTVYRLELQTAGEIARRLKGRPFVRELNWSQEAAQSFLRQKLIALPDRHLLGRRSNRVARPYYSGTFLIEQWLGLSEREITQSDEDALTFLRRHTRGIPRDLIILCNAIAEEVARSHAARESAITAKVFQKSVLACCQWFTDEQISCAVNDLICRRTRRQMSRSGSSNYLDQGDQATHLTGTLESALRDVVAGDIADTESLISFLRGACESIDVKEKELLRVLWQYRLLGFRRGDSEEYSELYAIGQFPKNAHNLVVNPYVRAAFQGQLDYRTSTVATREPAPA